MYCPKAFLEKNLSIFSSPEDCMICLNWMFWAVNVLLWTTCLFWPLIYSLKYANVISSPPLKSWSKTLTDILLVLWTITVWKCHQWLSIKCFLKMNFVYLVLIILSLLIHLFSWELHDQNMFCDFSLSHRRVLFGFYINDKILIKVGFCINKLLIQKCL